VTWVWHGDLECYLTFFERQLVAHIGLVLVSLRAETKTGGVTCCIVSDPGVSPLQRVQNEMLILLEITRKGFGDENMVIDGSKVLFVGKDCAGDGTQAMGLAMNISAGNTGDVLTAG